MGLDFLDLSKKKGWTFPPFPLGDSPRRQDNTRRRKQ